MYRLSPVPYVQLHAFRLRPRSSLWFLALALVAALPGSASAQPPTAQRVAATPRTIDPSSLPDRTQIDTVNRLLLEFAGELMTDDRARTIAQSAGYELLSWTTCPEVDNCVQLQVEGRKGHVFQYFVLGKLCMAEGLTPHKAPGRLETQAAQPPVRRRTRQPAAGARSAAGPRIDPRASGAVAPSLGAGSDAGKAHCFGGFTSYVRARQRNLFSVDDRSFLFSVEQDFQFLVDGHWTEAFSTVATAWDVPVPNSGQTERGYGYEWRDADGGVLAEDSEVVYLIASSGTAPAPTLEQLCRAEEAAVWSKGSYLAEFVTGIATLLLPIPESFAAELSLEPLGVGGVVNVSKSYPYTTVALNTARALAEVASSSTYLDCLKNPGRYDPGHFGPEPEPFLLEELGFEPINPELFSPEGNCPITDRVIQESELGGVHCTTTSQYVCQGTSDPRTGAEECTCERTSQTQVCTSGA